VAPVEHFAALPYVEIGAFMGELRAADSIPARALDFAILTVSRTDQTLGAQWSEIDTGNRLWTVPAGRMKSRKEHRVPLSDAAMAIVESMAAIRCNDFVFPGIKGDRLNARALQTALQRVGRTGLTPHGFRSTFSDWCAERTAYPAEVREMALAHAVGDKVEAAYRRGDLFEKRRKVMDDWATFCAMPAPAAGEIVPLRGRA
jgi:integrase